MVDTYVSYPVADLFSQPAYACGATPNGVTVLTFIIRCVAIYFLYQRKRPHLVLGLFVVSWFTDALDGLMARKYDMKSELGAHLDYLVDVTTTTATLSVLLLKYYTKSQFVALVGVLALLHVGQVIKLRGDSRSTASGKPWEKFLTTLPINIQSNCVIDAIDPGLTYVTLLAGIHYALFGLRTQKEDKLD